MSDALTITLDLIDSDPRGWPRNGLNQERVAEFAQAYLDGGPEALDPVQVIAVPPGRWLLVNGRHRVAARQAIGADNVMAVVIDTGGVDPVDFAYDYALADTARSALPLTRAEKHQAVVRLVTEHPDRTDVAIAALVGVSTKTVQRSRRRLADHPEAPPLESFLVRVPSPPTAADVATTLVRQLDKLWEARPVGMAIGLSDTHKLGDLIGQAFVDQVGAEQAVTWTERLSTWAARAHSAALDAEKQSTP